MVAGGKRVKNGRSKNKRGTNASCPIEINDRKQSKQPLSLSESLPPQEQEHLERCTLDHANTALDDDAFVQRAVSILEQEHVLIIHNCLNEKEIGTLHDCYEDLHRLQAGQKAIGEKDASKRSGTRLYNCLCQLGPACGF